MRCGPPKLAGWVGAYAAMRPILCRATVHTRHNSAEVNSKLEFPAGEGSAWIAKPLGDGEPTHANTSSVLQRLPASTNSLYEHARSCVLEWIYRYARQARFLDSATKCIRWCCATISTVRAATSGGGKYMRDGSVQVPT